VWYVIEEGIGGGGVLTVRMLACALMEGRGEEAMTYRMRKKELLGSAIPARALYLERRSPLVHWFFFWTGGGVFLEGHTRP